MTNCIEIKGLVKEYKTFTLGPIDLTVPGGSIMGLIGENGAGKTTLIKSMLGITRPTAGEASLLGTDPDHAKEDIGIVLDECFFSEYLRVKDVDIVLSRVFKSWDKGLFRDYLDKFGLAGTKNIKELSRGMRMKLSLAAALSHRPKLLLLDEATAGLDPVARDEILDLLLEFIQDEERSVFFSSHITSDIQKIADYVVLIHQGKIVFEEEKDVLLDRYGILRCPRGTEVGPGDYIARRETGVSAEYLVRDRAAAGREHPKAVADAASLEDIMLFYIKGEAS